jgi:hypothetical protein
MNVFTYRATSKNGKIYEGDIIASSEEEAFLELSTKPFLANNIISIDIRLKTSEEINVDNQLKRLTEYKKRLAVKAMENNEDEGPPTNTYVLTYREKPVSKSNMSFLKWCILLGMILALSAILTLVSGHVIEGLKDIGRNEIINGQKE